MNYNKQLSAIDAISILSFCISLMNLDENLSQNDKQDLQHDLASKSDIILNEIHTHLEEQDKKINKILEALNDGR
mgnify:CR=1 FL=1